MKFGIGILIYFVATLKYAIAGFSDTHSHEYYGKDEMNTFIVEMDEEAFDLF